jgi:tripartite-type tricarboxylate transporter receptor subunit TctC
MLRLVRRAALALLALGLAAGTAGAQGFPNKPIRIVVTFPPGGQTDVVARAVQPYLEKHLGQPVIIDNRPGAGGTIGVDAVAKSPPDGHMLGVGPMGALTVNQSLQEKMPYDTLKDLVPVSLLTTTPFVMAAPLSSKANNAADVIALAKAKSENLSIGHGGNGSAMHLTALLFNHMAGIDIPLVPYRGSAPAFADVVAGHIPLAVGDLTAALAAIRSGQMKPLGVSSAKRDPSLPNVPSFAEAGLAGYEAMGWFGIVVAAATPKEIVARLNEAVVAALKDPAVAGRMRNVGAEPHPTTPEEFAAFIRKEIDKWGRVVRQAGLKAN